MYNASISCIASSAVDPDDQDSVDQAPTRSQVAEYIHDIATQLAAMAQQAGLSGTADRLLAACSALAVEF